MQQDYVEAARWFLMAARSGHDTAQYNLGSFYRFGNGVHQNDVEAARWFRLSADQGFAMAQYMLGNMYGAGEGLQQDFVQASMWWNLAAAQSNTKAIEIAEIIAQLMTPEEIATAQRLATEWRPSPN